MLLTTALITGSAFYIGATKYKERQKRKKKPWTFYAEKIEKRQLAKRRGRKNHTLLSTEIPSQIVAWAKFSKEKICLLLPYSGSSIDSRRQQLKEISSASDESEVNEVEQKLNRDLTISAISLAFASAGPLLYPPLSILTIPGLSWLTLVASKDAYHSFKQGRGLSVDVLTTLFFAGTIATGSYFAGALGAFFVRFSKKLLAKTEDHSSQSLINVFGHQTRFVCLLSDGIEVEVSVDTLSSGDIIVLHAGETIAVDGTIIEGQATIDQHILTGESQPAEKKVGEQVFASTVVLSGQIKICVEKAGEETVAAQIGEILNQTADFKKEILSWGEGIADMSARMTMGLSALVLPFFGATTAVTILNSSFGLYMRFLSPISMLTFLNLASNQGILVKDGRSLQLLSQVDTVVFDKTGTLTQEVPHVGKIHTCLGISDLELLTYAAAAEYKQTHPIALAIREAASQRGLTLPEIGEVNVEVGYGLKVSIEDQLIRVGSQRFMEMSSITIPSEIKQIYEDGHEHGYSFVYVAVDEQLWGAIELHATIRPEAKQIITQLRERGIEMYIISGDHENPTKQLAQEVGIEHYFAETLPENKAKLIEQLQQDGKSVCFVGDGINDSIALKKANVSVSLRGASSAATDTAQIVLMNQNLEQLIQAFDIADKFKSNMSVNTITTVLPGVITVFGAFFLGFGVAHSVILNDIGMIIGASNAIWPFFREQKKKQKQSQEGI